jgi:DNA-binding NarL/FixJ family response regulator
MPAPLTVALARFAPIVELGLRQLLGGDRCVQIVGTGLDCDGLELVVRQRAPRVVILDEPRASTPFLRRLLELRPQTGLLVVAHVPSRASSIRLLAHGATACLSTDASATELLGAIRLAAAGTHVLVLGGRDSPVTRPRPGGVASLTVREREVLALLARGLSNAQIALALHISIETVRTHAARIYRKLGVVNRVELVGISLDARWPAPQ